MITVSPSAVFLSLTPSPSAHAFLYSLLSITLSLSFPLQLLISPWLWVYDGPWLCRWSWISVIDKQTCLSFGAQPQCWKGHLLMFKNSHIRPSSRVRVEAQGWKLGVTGKQSEGGENPRELWGPAADWMLCCFRGEFSLLLAQGLRTG